VSAVHAEPTPPVTTGGVVTSWLDVLSVRGVPLSGVKTPPSTCGNPLSWTARVSVFGGMVTSLVFVVSGVLLPTGSFFAQAKPNNKDKTRIVDSEARIRDLFKME